MKKLLKKLLLGTSLFLFVGIAPLTSCSSIFGEDGYVITDIDTQFDTVTGMTTIIITTTDEENPTLTFNVPQGVEGAGIANVEADIIDTANGKTIHIVITYTDPSLPDTVLDVPLTNGEDGRSVTGLTYETDEDSVNVTFTYSDGTTSQVIEIPRGIDGLDGKNGNGIASVTADSVSKPGVTVITITFDDPSMPPVTFELQNGKDGKGIESVSYDSRLSTSTEYAIKITYTDGTSEYIYLPIPNATIWHYGTSAPKSSLGKKGDFYLNITDGYVYTKTSNTAWTYLLCMYGTNSATTFTVTFDLSAYTDATWDAGSEKTYTMTVGYGKYISLNSIPTPVRSGYTFLGWYTTRAANPNAGHFTDLTPVLQDMYLYPHWE